MPEVWKFAMSADALDRDGVAPAGIGGEEIAIYRIGGKLFATQDRCTHGEAYLSEGRIAGGAVECPLHRGRFCIASGRPLSAPAAVPLRVYPVREADGAIFIGVPQG